MRAIYWQVMTLATRRWLVGAFYDELTDKQKFELYTHSDTSSFKKHSRLNPFPYELLLDFMWFDVNSTNLKKNRRDYFHYLNYSGVIPALTAKYSSADDYVGIALLLDCDLLMRNSAESLYVQIIKHEFFVPKKHPFHFISCFGGTPQDGMRCAAPSASGEICSIRQIGCTNCEPIERLTSCNHTCYWFFVGLLLGAYSKPKQINPINDEDIRRALPKAYIY